MTTEAVAQAANECCVSLKMAMQRDLSNRDGVARGFEVNTVFRTRSERPQRNALVYRFTAAKKDDTTEFGTRSELAHTTYALVNYCPFCGAYKGP